MNTSYYRMIPARGRIYSQLRFDDMMHGFLNMEQLAPERCRALYQAMTEFLVDCVGIGVGLGSFESF